MTDLNDLIGQLHDETAWQVTPTALSKLDYLGFIKYGLKHLYIDTGRAAEFSNDMITTSKNESWFEADLPIDEEQYVLILAQIAFFKKVQSDNNTRVSYTTDALSVTGGDKPYAHLKDSIEKLENERRIIFYKMTSYNVPTVTDD